MKKAIVIFFLFLFSIVIYEVFSYSTYGAPAEFGNDSLTTCYIGGDLGVINCTGNITGSVFVGDGSGLTNVVNTESDPKWSANFTNMIVDCPGGNYSYGLHVNGSLKCRSDIDTTAAAGGNCSGEGSCSLITYDLEFQNYSIIRNLNLSWITGNQNLINNCSVGTSCSSITYDSELAYINNCSVDQSCSNVIYTTDKLGNTTLEIQEVSWANVTAGQWILPEHILDVDKENIEGDMNTFVDIPGDEMTGDFNVSGARAQFKSADGDGKIAVIIDGDGEATDFPLVIRAGSNPAVLGFSDRVCTVDFAGSVNCSGSFYGSAFYDDDVLLVDTTIGNCSVDASCGPIVYSSNTSFLKSFDSNVSTACSGTFTTMNGDGDCVTFLGSVLGDTTPQLGGYLDANGKNIGSTSDEIENIYIGVNTKLFLGDGQEGEVYFDGTKLIIKVN